jgi:putative transport protein
VTALVDLLADNPLLLLFVVAALGQLLGRITVGTFSLGVAGVLFAGIAVGAVDERLELPELVVQLGLAVFVYALGLAAGPAFARAMRGPGLALNGVVTAVLAASAGAVAGAAAILGLDAGQGAGLFTGVLTNTPALAGVVETLSGTGRGDPDEPVVAYSIAYPASVVASILVVTAVRRLAAHIPALPEPDEDDSDEGLTSRVVEVVRRMTVTDLDQATGRRVLVGRILHHGEQTVADPLSVLRPGDLVGVVGPRKAVESAIPLIGVETSRRMLRDRSVLDFRRIFVSNRSLVGRQIRDLDLPGRYEALVTRVRRGDADLVGHPDLVLELGDRVRVVAPPARMPELTRLFGDSYRALGEVDVATFSIGLALGLLLGVVDVPLPGGGSFSLGFAGGPLVVGLVLGIVRRTGSLVWQLPYGAGLTLRQFGLVLFFAGIGTRAGQRFAEVVASSAGVALFAAAFVLSLLIATVTLLVATGPLRMGFWAATGVLAGTFTQPATLAFATEQARNDEPEKSYAAVAPLAILVKILLAQALLLVL